MGLAFLLLKGINFVSMCFVYLYYFLGIYGFVYDGIP